MNHSVEFNNRCMVWHFYHQFSINVTSALDRLLKHVNFSVPEELSAVTNFSGRRGELLDAWIIVTLK